MRESRPGANKITIGRDDLSVKEMGAAIKLAWPSMRGWLSQVRIGTLLSEQHCYLAKATPVLRDVAMLMLETGMRPEEVYTIRRENVDLVKGNIQVPYGKTAAARRSSV